MSIAHLLEVNIWGFSIFISSLIVFIIAFSMRKKSYDKSNCFYHILYYFNLSPLFWIKKLVTKFWIKKSNVEINPRRLSMSFKILKKIINLFFDLMRYFGNFFVLFFLIFILAYFKCPLSDDENNIIRPLFLIIISFFLFLFAILSTVRAFFIFIRNEEKSEGKIKLKNIIFLIFSAAILSIYIAFFSKAIVFDQTCGYGYYYNIYSYLWHGKMDI